MNCRKVYKTKYRILVQFLSRAKRVFYILFDSFPVGPTLTLQIPRPLRKYSEYTFTCCNNNYSPKHLPTPRLTINEKRTSVIILRGYKLTASLACGYNIKEKPGRTMRVGHRFGWGTYVIIGLYLRPAINRRLRGSL